jgi:tetratricopeptide (TPR) repeat protein
MLNRSTISFTLTLVLIFSNSVLAATKKTPTPDKFPPNPLEVTKPDPLLPGNAGKQPLTTQELQELEVALDKLNQEANKMFQSGDKIAAFDTWNRELRLRRYLGKVSELRALGRVGEIAWQNNERLQVQYITQRLQKIQKENIQDSDLDTLQSLAQGYQKVRSPKSAIEVYEQILAKVRQQPGSVNEVDVLNAIASLHMSWFDYDKAATTYQQLLGIATAKGDGVGKVNYLKQLAYVYQQARLPEESIKIRNKLAEIYAQSNPILVPQIKIAIASDYELLAKSNPTLLPFVFNNYQQAYQIAWGQQQYATAGEALQKLVNIYRTQGQIDAALQTSQILLETEEIAGDFYGLMQAYDVRGQLYLIKQDTANAIASYQKGLEIATQLNHQQDYFTQQIQKLSSPKAN